MAVAFGDADDDDVGAGADGGGVAAEVGAERQRPPQDVGRGRVAAGLRRGRATIGAMVAT